VRRNWPAGYDRHVFDTLDSTLSEAARMLPHLSGPAWIMTPEQTAGRGRRGRPWAAVRGNFAGTLVMRRQEEPAIAALRSFVTSLALYRTFEAVTGQPDAFALKWPNDVLMRGGKVAGILLESTGDHLMIGIGVNLLHAPDRGEVEARAVPPVSLAADLGVEVTPEDFLDTLAAEYAVLEDQFTTHGFAPVRRAWLDHAARLGEVITARTMRDETMGTFEDIDDQGNLILRTAAGLVPITAADVFF
jgi:BirA family biotin operon repressor/biotin-[acetyl-CoA-carboxylase] ligase